MKINEHQILLERLYWKFPQQSFMNFTLDIQKPDGAPLAIVDVINFVSLTFRKKISITIYEVKTNRTDFLNDIQSGKSRKYLPYCHYFYYAAPKGLICLKEIRETYNFPEAGLIEYNPNKNIWRCPWRGKALERKIEIPDGLMMSLILKGFKMNYKYQGLKRDIRSENDR